MDEPLEPADLPELLPARMLNEFIYCPRLFYLEWVEPDGRTMLTPPRDDTSTAGSIGTVCRCHRRRRLRTCNAHVLSSWQTTGLG